jgi:Ca-activated chloride channel family protein
MLRALLTLLTLCLASPSLACQTALVLAVDVSGSIDPHEYLLETNGLADAIEAPEIADALTQGEVALALVHWSGVGHQRLALPWQRMMTPADVAAFATAVRSIPRPRDYSDTAIAEAILFSIRQFAAVPDCAQSVIDLSGDGVENATNGLPEARRTAITDGVTINAIAIERNDISSFLSGYFRNRVITPGGFVITAQGLADYPRAIRLKLLRELTKPVS